MERKKIGFSFLILAVVLAFSIGSKNVSAAPITGTIGFGGSMTTVDAGNNVLTNFLGATGFIDFVNVDVETVSGDYLTEGFAVNDLATYSNFNFNPLSPSPVQLWTITKGSVTATFELSAVNVDYQSASAIVLSGTGTLSMTGYDLTAGIWDFTSNSTGGSFSFSTTNAVPEPGTIALLGIGLAGLVGVGVRRKMKKNVD